MSEEQLDAQAESDLYELLESQKNESSEVEDLDTLSEADLRKALKKARKEAASRRVANREMEAAAKSWEEHKKSQMSEMEKLREALAESNTENATLKGRAIRDKVALKYGISDEDVQTFFGDSVDEEHLEKIAKALREKSPGSGPSQTAGQRGGSVGGRTQSDQPKDFNDWLLREWKRVDAQGRVGGQR